MAKKHYGYVYSSTSCPNCSRNLTEPDSIALCVIEDKGIREIELKDRLILVEEGCGVLADERGKVAAGRHSQTLCGECSESLFGMERQFTWTVKKERDKSLAEAIKALKTSEEI